MFHVFGFKVQGIKGLGLGGKGFKLRGLGISK